LLVTPSGYAVALEAAAAATQAAGTAATAYTAFAYAYVGTYTPNGGGIYLFRSTAHPAHSRNCRSSTMSVTVVAGREPGANAPLRCERDRQLRWHAQWRRGSYAIDPETSQLARLGAVRSAGVTPAYVSVHPSGKFVFVANFGGGNVAVFPVAGNGALSEASDVRPSVGARHRSRAVDDPPGQFAVSDHDSPHLHMVAPTLPVNS